jgi:hypothetical protein
MLQSPLRRCCCLLDRSEQLQGFHRVLQAAGVLHLLLVHLLLFLFLLLLLLEVLAAPRACYTRLVHIYCYMEAVEGGVWAPTDGN